MGREVRMVPADWQHPTDGKYANGETRYVPLLDGSFDTDAAEWDEARRQWDAGYRKNDFLGDEWIPRSPNDPDSYEGWAGDQPRAEDYMPNWPEEQRTHYMMYESCSEGTPISPAFETPEDLARWLADNNASAFGSQTASYGQWLATIKRGWSVSAIASGGAFMSGVEAMADDAD